MSNYKNIVQQLGIQTKKENGSRLEILCPFHFDKHFGSAFLNTDSGWITCYSCKANKHVYHVIKKLQPQLSHKEIQLKLGWSNQENFASIISKKIEMSNKLKNKTVEWKNPFHKSAQSIESIKKITSKDLESFNPNDYRYLFERGFTKEFCSFHNIQLIKSGTWKDYIYIPIEIIENKILTSLQSEVRKVNEYKYFQECYPDKMSLKEMRHSFKENVYAKNSYFSELTVLSSNEIDSYTKLYLSKPRVLYSNKIEVNKTLWQLKNLNKNKTLYLREGISGCARIWKDISRNVTCTFSSQVYKEQLDLLSKFKEVILIPDNDDAGVTMVYALRNLKNVKVVYIESEDTDENFIRDINSSIQYDCIEWIFRYYDFEIRIR